MNLPPSALKKSKGGNPPSVQGPITTQSIPHPNLANRLSEGLKLPRNVVDIILNTTYLNNLRETKPVFGLAPSSIAPNEWIYNHQEVQEIVIYYKSLIVFSVATETEPAQATNLEQAYEELERHMHSLALNRQLKSESDTLVDDDSVFENPQLAKFRSDEILRMTFLNRKKVPVAGVKCRSRNCGVEEVCKESLYTRSGDEAAVEFHCCQRCGYKW
jgi:DNA-directed RNA polymerase subunit M/transcription elongation factor TFIIS